MGEREMSIDELITENSKEDDDIKKIHLGLIPDGNRRWCLKNNCDVFNLLNVLKKFCISAYEEKEKLGHEKFSEEYNHLSQVGEITIYILSKDNLLKRNDSTLIMIEEGLKMTMIQKKDHFKCQFIGEIELLPENIYKLCKEIEEETKNNSKILLSLGIAYDPLSDSKKILTDDSKRSLYKQSDIDLVIRTGNEIRTSGFFPLKTLYSEFFFLENLFPDTTLSQINNCIGLYNKRKRRFGE